MEFQSRPTLLPDGTKTILRSPRPEDAAEMLRYKVTMSGETEYVGRYPEEITETLPDEIQSISDTLQSESSLLITAFSEQSIIGNAGIFPVSARIKLKHRAEFCIAVLKPWWHLGIGKILTEECISAAMHMGYESVELSASASNDLALKLYQSVGFIEYGRLHNAFALKDGSYDDAVLMALHF